jgi:hypothetical protein
MERSSKRGKIPQGDWPLIIKRYEAGETLAAIARTYDCSPPAISYILSRSRARDATGEGAAQSAIERSESGLMKTQASEAPLSAESGETEIGGAVRLIVEAQASTPVEELSGEPTQVELAPLSGRQVDAPDGHANIVAAVADGPTQRRVESRDSLNPRKEGNSPYSNLSRPVAVHQKDEPRRTLHLPLSQHDNHRSEPQRTHAPDSSEGPGIQSASGQQQVSFTAPSRQHSDRYAATNSGETIRAITEPHKVNEGGAFIDRALRERVDEDIAAFLAAFDAALAADSLESRVGLREATDRLLRAGARTRIELERLEARVPLPARESSGRPASTWRPR